MTDMEAHLRKVTRCLSQAIGELELVSESDKTARQVDDDWMARFHAAIVVPTPLTEETKFGRHAGQTPSLPSTGEDQHCADARWCYLSFTWLPLLRDLQRTVDALDTEEKEFQAMEREQEGRESQSEGNRSEGMRVEHGRGHAATSRHDRAPPRPPKGLLSLRDYTVIHTALEIVVHWGLALLLEPGAGVFETDKRARSRAVKVSRRILQFWGGSTRRTSAGPPVNVSTAAAGDATVVRGANERAQLTQCAGVIESIVTTEQFLPMLLPLYLSDVLAARLQLAYGRDAATRARRKAQGGKLRSQMGGSNTASTSSRHDAPEHALSLKGPSDTVRGRDGPRRQLSSMLDDLSPREIMGALRQLLSQGTRAPPWLRQHAGRILSEIVLQPGGVQATLETYLAGTWVADGGPAADGAKGGETIACLRVAKLLATPPKRVDASAYLVRVAPQLVDMLHYNGQQRAIVTRVVVMIIGRLSESMPEDTKQYLATTLLRPLLLFWGPDCRKAQAEAAAPCSSSATAPSLSAPGRSSQRLPARAPSASAAAGLAPEVGRDGVLANEEAVETCLADLEKLLTAAPAPGALLRICTDLGVTIPLFHLHCFCKRSKSRHLQTTKACLAALLHSSPTAAAAGEMVECLLPTRTTWRNGSDALFAAGGDGGAVLRLRGRDVYPVGSEPPTDCEASASIPAETMKDDVPFDYASGSTRTDSAGGKTSARFPSGDESLLDLEQALGNLGIGPEALRWDHGETGVEDAAAGYLMNAVTGLKEAEVRARDAADLLDSLGEPSPVAGKVFDLLLRRYLALRDGCESEQNTSSFTPARAQASTRGASSCGSAEADAKEEHAVMASVVVLAEQLGARVFGTGMQMLSCVRLVLEHEQPRWNADEAKGVTGADSRLRSRGEAMEGLSSSSAQSAGSWNTAPEGGEENIGSDDDGGTLCSVVLGLLTTILELGEKARTDEEEEEFRAMLEPLKALATGHRDPEVAEMSAALCSSILSRGLTQEERAEGMRRVPGTGPRRAKSAEGRQERTSRMLLAIQAAGEDLRSEAVPMRARGVVTLTRLLRTMLGVGPKTAVVDMDEAVLERLMYTYTGMTGDDDSYVYLAAVQGLATLADAMPSWCIPRLVGAFVGSAPASGACDETVVPCGPVVSTSLPLSQRLKIGEAVLLSARRCGQAMPKYAHFYVNAFVIAARERWQHRETPVGCDALAPGSSSVNSGAPSSSLRGRGASEPRRDLTSKEGTDAEDVTGRSKKGGEMRDASASRRCGEELKHNSLEDKESYHFRASCLSNLAEVCQLLRWSLGRFSADIVDLGVGVLSMETGGSEEAILARRGAAFLLGQLLKGAGGDILQMVPMANLRSSYRALKRAVESDRDDVTRTHAQRGLDYLDRTLRDQLFPGRGNSSGSIGPGVAGGGSGHSHGHHPGITVL